MTSSEKPEPQGSEPSSTDLHKWKRCAGCGHQQHSVRCAESVSLDEYKQGACDCLELTPAVDIAKTCRSGGGCSKHPKTALFEKYEKPKPKPCTCGPDEVCGDPCTPVSEECNGICLTPADIGLPEYGGAGVVAYPHPDCPQHGEPSEPEPPLTPEEEEEAPEDRIHPADCVQGDGCPYLKPTCENGCKAAADELVRLATAAPPQPEDEVAALWNELHRRDTEADQAELPPQPERRAPYVATYSVGGHLYEVAVPGDACLQAVDGVLVIRHGLGPVAGLVGFQPLSVEEKA